MNLKRFRDGRLGYLLASVLALVGLVLPTALPLSVSAATVAGRKITLSTSQKSATGVSYRLQFTNGTSSATAIIVDFCSDSPIIADSSCTAPAGFSTSGVTSTPSGASSINTSNNGVKLTGQTIASGASVDITFSGFTNPNYVTDGTNGFYARIYTYASDVASNGHTSATTVGTYQDSGGIAMNISNPIAVSAAVRETLVFCVANTTPTATCGGLSSPTTDPNLVLGHGSPKAIDATAIDDNASSPIYAQISTNALSGASVNMKIDNTCGGLQRTGSSTCDIAPAGSPAITMAAGNGKIGMRVGTAVNASGGTASGTVVPTAPYASGSQYGMDWVSGNATGVGSTYGSKIFDTSTAPIANKNVPLVFATSAAIDTPAGNYKANFYLVATGTF